MKTTFSFIALCVGSLLLTACGDDSSPACGGSSLAAGTHVLEMEVGGRLRSYRLHVPSGHDLQSPLPLVLNFHAVGQNAALQEDMTKMSPAADARGYVVVYPEGVDNDWSLTEERDEEVDDVAFARALIDEVAGSVCIDESRIYATGICNGAYMAHRLGCEAGELIAAIAPVASTQTVAMEDCSPSRPVPVMSFHGLDDFFAPFADRAQPTHEAWAELNGCTAEAETSFENGDAVCETLRDCAEDTEVTLCSIENHEHCWPGQDLCPWKSSSDILATEAMMDFFDRFSLP